VQRYPDSTSNCYWDQQISEQVQNNKKKVENKHESASINKRNFTKSEVTGSRAAASIQENTLQSVLKRDQLKQCGLAYINNGIIRTVVDRTVFFINPERTEFVIQN
jgi:hypothetical protein